MLGVSSVTRYHTVTVSHPATTCPPSPRTALSDPELLLGNVLLTFWTNINYSTIISKAFKPFFSFIMMNF